MPHSGIKPEFRERIELSEKEKLEHTQRVRQSILNHKYGGMAFREEQEKKRKQAER